MKITEDSRIKILSGTHYHIGMIARVKDIKPDGECTIVLGPDKFSLNISQIDTNSDNAENSVKQGFSAIIVK